MHANTTNLINWVTKRGEEEKRVDEEERGCGRRRRGRGDSGNLVFSIAVVPHFYQWRYLA